MAQRDQEHTRFGVVFQRGLEVLGGKFWVFAKPPNDCFVV